MTRDLGLSLDSLPLHRRRVYEKHPDVKFTPGPFYMGAGWLGWTCNAICITWTLFICVLFSLPTYFPVTAVNMNYASVITVGVIALSLYVRPFPTSSSTLTAIFRLKKDSGTSLGALLFFRAGNVTHRLTTSAGQGDTTRAPFHTPTDTKNRPRVTAGRASPTRTTQALL